MLHEKCSECPRISGDTCSVYINPLYWWEIAASKQCPFAPLTEKEIQKRKLRNPLKWGKGDLPQMPKSRGSDWPASGIKTPKRLRNRKGR